MNNLKKIYDSMTKFMKLSIIWIVKILFAKSHFKVNIFKRIYFAINGGFMPDQIVLYNLNKHNKKEYLSEFDWYKSRKINGKYGFLMNNKLICSDLMKKHVDVPDIYYYKEKNILNSYNNLKCDYDSIEKLIKDKKIVIIKPISKGKGNGVAKIEFKNNKFYINNEVINSLKNYLIDRDNWFISKYIIQSEELNNIFSESSNTIRLITAKDPDTKRVLVIAAVQRFGTKETIPVDNGSKGGLVANIDLETGQLSCAKSIQKACNYVKHPDTNEQIEGKIIKNWNSIKKTYIDLMEKFPYFKFIAWDILLTNEGNVLLEANSSSGVNIIQIWGGQRNGKLGEIYKKYDIIKKLGGKNEKTFN